LHIQHIHLGCDDKLPVYNTLLTTLNITDQHVCYIGDDINDLPILARAGMKIAVNNAMPIVKEQVDYVTQRSGGQGAVREICDFLIEQHRS